MQLSFSITTLAHVRASILYMNVNETADSLMCRHRWYPARKHVTLLPTSARLLLAWQHTQTICAEVNQCFSVVKPANPPHVRSHITEMRWEVRCSLSAMMRRMAMLKTNTLRLKTPA